MPTWATSARSRFGSHGSGWCFRACCSTISAKARSCCAIRRRRLNPFYLLAPRTLLYPLIALATVAAVIASQALISGAFSLTQQCVQLGYSPRVTIVHTSAREAGQIYIPEVNDALMVSCLLVVVGFGSSTRSARPTASR